MFRISPRTAAILSVIGVLLMLGFSPLSRLSAGALPSPPRNLDAVYASSVHNGSTAVTQLPEGLPENARVRTLADVYPYAVAALGVHGAQDLMSLLASKTFLAQSVVTGRGFTNAYPFDYRALDPILNAAPRSRLAAGATALGAALSVLAAQPQGITTSLTTAYMTITNAGPAAYGVLDRARADGGCAPQLDLLLLVASYSGTVGGAGPPLPGVLAQEERRAEAACPGNPTPGWIVGQAVLRTLLTQQSTTYADPQFVAFLRNAEGEFRRLAAEYPRDTAVLTGLGDSYLRAGTYLAGSEPFTARQDFRTALAAYNRATAAGAGTEAAPGIARALIGLGEPAAAARLTEPLTRTATAPGEFLELLVLADETAHDYTDALAASAKLAGLGDTAYPDGNALFPASLNGFISPLDDASLPLSFGAGQMMPLSVQLTVPGGAGGYAQDISFIPQYRKDTGITGTQPWCPSWTAMRDELVVGQPAAALRDWSANFLPVHVSNDYYCSQSANLYLLAQLQAGQQPDPAMMKSNHTTRDDLYDSWQNLLRWAGQLSAAKTVAMRWQSADGDTSGIPSLRVGEIDFLMRDYGDAATEFDLAAHRYSLASYNDTLDIDQAELDQGTALMAAGQRGAAAAVLRPLDLQGTEGYSYQNSTNQGDASPLQFAAISYFACEQLGDYESSSGQPRVAIEDYSTALNWAKTFGYSSSGVVPEVLDNNSALASLRLGDVSTAAALENKALAADPGDPVFLMSAGFIADRAGRVAQAAGYDRAALDSDPGAFPAANDLGVELARERRYAAATQSLRQAVGASPRYALGWFNLGVADSSLGPAHLPAAQGAFAKAYELDPGLKSRQHTMTIDASVYRTALDLSKPVPPRWSLSQLPQPAPAAAAGLLAILMLALGLTRGTGHGGSALAAQWLDPLSDRLTSVPVLRRLHHPFWGIAATAGSFLFAYLRRDAGATEVVVYTVGVVLLALLAMGARLLVARRERVGISHESWRPGLAFGLVTGAAFGLPWAPLPVIKEDTPAAGEDRAEEEEAEENGGKPRRKVHLAAPVALAMLSAALFVEFVWLQTPLADAWAVAALIMAASTLLPVAPLDGAKLGKEGTVAAAGLVGGAILVGLGLI